MLLIRLIYEQVLAELQATVARGLSVEFATDGQQAIERLSREPSIDLLLIDLYIPGPSGFEVIEHAREHRQCRGIRIAVISARDSGDRDLAQALGIDAFLHKPVSSDLLKSTVMRLLGGQ